MFQNLSLAQKHEVDQNIKQNVCLVNSQQTYISSLKIIKNKYYHFYETPELKN